MKSTPQQTITRLLQHFHLEEDQKAFDRLFGLVYDELHQIAKKRRRQWHGNHTLNTTAILHEAYLKLVDQSEADWQSRAHFYAAASRAMRHILINYARDRKRQKRGGDHHRVSFERLHLAASGGISLSDDRIDAMIALEEALGRLEKLNPRQSQIVECRFFGSMTVEETAAALGISPMTVKRGWKMAQLWLYREMNKELES